MAAQIDIAEINNNFAAVIFSSLSSTKDNVFYSPWSLFNGLEMTYVGAKQNTAKQLSSLLGYSKLQTENVSFLDEEIFEANKKLIECLSEVKTDGVDFVTANKIWIQSGFEILDAFLTTLRERFLAGPGIVNFVGSAEDARSTINAWVEDITKKKIESLIPPGMLDSLTRLVLTNAVYFKGSWMQAFNKQHTTKKTFKVNANKTVQAEMMYMKTQKVRYCETEKLQILGLPYKGKRLVMTIVLPRKLEGIKSTIDGIIKDTSQINKWINAGSVHQDIEIHLPKIKISTFTDFNEMLSSLGANEMFDDNLADFTGITEKRLLKVTSVIQKAFIEVNEEGTEAAAATAVVMSLRCALPRPTRPLVFNADHPFLFFIADTKTKIVLFWGKVEDPTLN